MKRFGNLWPEVVSFPNLYNAYLKARTGKKTRPEVAKFTVNLESELFTLQSELISGCYRPAEYRLFTIYERKPRQIAAAPFRDRVIHHAIMNILDPLMDKGFIGDSYACRKGKGVHQAVARYQTWAKRYPYTLKLDISRYFPSVDHQILKTQFRHKLKDRALLALLDVIIDTSPILPIPPQWFEHDDLLTPLERRHGIPIGNLTSQFFANFYLNGLDHFVKEQLKAKAYLRYVDDMILLSDSKSQLWDWSEQIALTLSGLRLCLHPHKRQLYQTRCGVDVLGYRVYPEYRLLRNDNGHRFSRKLRRFAEGYRNNTMEWCDFNPSVQSWIGHATKADTVALRKKIFGSTLFYRGTDQC